MDQDCEGDFDSDVDFDDFDSDVDLHDVVHH